MVFRLSDVRRRAALLVAALLGACVLVAAPVSAADAGRASYRLHLERMPDGTHKVMRWNPCQRRITYRVNVRAVRPAKRRAAVRLARRSVRKLARATDMRFGYRGRTRAVPYRTSWGRLPAEIVIAYVRPGQVGSVAPELRSALGLGGPMGIEWQNRRGRWRLAALRGGVLINERMVRGWRFGFGRHTRGNVLLHELAHVAGLNHVNDRRQLMYRTEVAARRGYASGDRAGLRRVGRAAGCMRVPSDTSWPDRS